MKFLSGRTNALGPTRVPWKPKERGRGERTREGSFLRRFLGSFTPSFLRSFLPSRARGGTRRKIQVRWTSLGDSMKPETDTHTNTAGPSREPGGFDDAYGGMPASNHAAP